MSRATRTARAARWGRILASAGLLLATLTVAAGADLAPLEREVNCRGLDLQVDGTGRWTTLHLPTGYPMVALGEPAVPSLRVPIRLPAGADVAGVRLTVLDEEWLALSLPILPYAGEQSSRQTTPPVADPQPAVYEREDPFPAGLAQLVTVTERSDGVRFAIVQVNPLQYQPVAERLRWIRTARLQVDLRPFVESGGLRRERAPLRFQIGAEQEPEGGQVLLQAPGLAPSETPSVEGTPIEYVIISPDDQEMRTEWQRLADWKTSCGHPAIVVTTDWIDENYTSGCDAQERIRLFLRDAYIHWGLRWALIGADPELVPVRYARSWGLDRETGRDIACDFYLACLDGTWDADRDGVFGESEYGIEGADTLVYLSDDVDFTPDIHVGRVSARTGDEVDDWLDKYFTYVESPPGDGYLDRDLLLGEVLFDAQWTRYGRDGEPDCGAAECFSDPTCRLYRGQPVCARTDGTTYCVNAAEAILETEVEHELHFLTERPEYWDQDEIFLDPQAILLSDILSSESTISYLNGGYHLAHHVGHADRDRWAVGGTSPLNSRMLINDLWQLTNGNDGHHFIVYGVNCSSAAIEYDSFAEAMLLLPDGGCLAYVGATNADFPSMADRFAQDFYTFLFSEPGNTVGDGHFLSVAANVLTGDAAHGDGTQRFLLFTQLILGDPGMPVWWATPSSADVTFDAEVALGSGPLSVSVSSGGSPVDEARVCVHKEGEIYVIAETAANGSVEIPFAAVTTGEFQVVVTSPHHYPVTATGQVVAATGGAVLVSEAVTIVDDGTQGSSGNANGQVEIGETIRLALTIGNDGQEDAPFVQARLNLGEAAPAGVVTIADSIADIGALTAGSSVTDEEAFLLEVSRDLDEEAYFGERTLLRLPLDLVMQTGKAEFSSSLTLEVTRPELQISPNYREDPSENIVHLWLGLRNTGRGMASGYVATLVPITPHYVEVTSAEEMAVADVAPGDTLLVGPYELEVSNQALAKLDFSVLDLGDDPPDTLHHRVADLRAPFAPENLTATGLPQAVELRWDESIDPSNGTISGYLIHRAEVDGGEYELALDGILGDHRYLNDSDLGHLTQYQYWVQAVDGAGNLGDSSEVVFVYTSPPVLAGWPGRFRGFGNASPLVCELDGTENTGREIIFGGDLLYAFHADGTEMTDGDQIGSTYGPFAPDGYGYWGKAAAADLDRNGVGELVAVAKEAGAGAGEGELICWDRGGGTPKWKVDLSVHPIKTTRAWLSPTLADFDGNDGGMLEVILCSGQNRQAGIYAFNHDGTEMIEGSSGLVLNLNGVDLYHSPAVGDVDGDGALEVVMSTRVNTEDRPERGALWVVKPDGSVVPGFEDGLSFEELGLAQQTTGSPTLYDVDMDGRDEIFVVTPARLWCVDDAGILLWSAPFSAVFEISNDRGLLSEPALGDVNGDESVEIALVDEGEQLWLYDAATGAVLEGFPIDLTDAVGTKYGSCILANVDEDELPEIVFGDNDKHIHAYKSDGSIARGFPIFFGGSFLKMSLAVWDVDLDGFQNLVAQAENVLGIAVYDLQGAVFDSDNPGLTNPWPMRYRDDRNTGRYVDTLPVGVRVALSGTHVDATGQVTLRWVCGERVAEFRVRRRVADSEEWVLAGAVPGASQPGPQEYLFADLPPGPGTFVYRIDPVLMTGAEETGPTVQVQVGYHAPRALAFQRVSPSPLAPSQVASVAFTIPGGASDQVPIELHVLDIQGRRVRTLVDDRRSAGLHTAYWDGRDARGGRLASGLYLLHLSARGRVDVARLLVVQ